MEGERPPSTKAPEPRASTVLRLEGRDALDLLHRISTASLADLAQGQCRAAPFCDFRGRLLHRAVVAASQDGALWLMRDDAPGDELLAFVERSVFREDVRIADLGARWSVTGISGESTLPAGAVEERDGVPVRAQVTPDWAHALVPAGTPLPRHDEAARIRAGRPRHGHEIHPDFTPFEVGLAHEVHLAKGCYPGQEALMRLVTYRSVRRRLVRIPGTGSPPASSAAVRQDGAAAGRLTSVAADGGGWVALAVLRHEAARPDARLEIEGSGTAAPEPFDPTQPLGLG